MRFQQNFKKTQNTLIKLIPSAADFF